MCCSSSRPGFNSNAAIQDVRAKVDQAKRDLPADADEPGVFEVNISLFPVVVVTLSGDLCERTLTTIARDAKNTIEQVPGVLVGGRPGNPRRGGGDHRRADAARQLWRIADLIRRQAAAGGNSLVAAGALEGPQGRFAIKVPALIEKPEDVLNIPVAASSLGERDARRRRRYPPDLQGRHHDHPGQRQAGGGDRGEEAHRRQRHRDRRRRARGGRAAGRSAGRNRSMSPSSRTSRRKSGSFSTTCRTASLTGVLLVVVIMLFILGGRASLFIGIAIPASFLTGILGLDLFGMTLNIVALFSLILAVGMLVDDAIIVSEFAERRMSEGIPRARGLCARRHPHVRPGDGGHPHPHRRLLAAAVLARHRRPVHEVPADHADRDAVGLAGDGADLHADARRDDRPCPSGGRGEVEARQRPT